MKLGGFLFFPRLYNLSRRWAILAMVPVSAQEETVWCFSRSDEAMRDIRKSEKEQAADLPLLRLFSQIVNSFEARYTDDQTLNGLMRRSCAGCDSWHERGVLGGVMDDEMKALVKQYIDRRKHQRQDLVKELGLSEVEADQAVSTLELYFDVEASEEQWAQAWTAAKRDFLADGERTGIRLADLVVKYVDIARLGGGPASRWT